MSSASIKGWPGFAEILHGGNPLWSQCASGKPRLMHFEAIVVTFIFLNLLCRFHDDELKTAGATSGIAPEHLRAVKHHKLSSSLAISFFFSFREIPPGWTTATDHRDGRIFYLEIETGRRCWTHPNAPPAAAASATGRHHNPPLVQGFPVNPSVTYPQPTISAWNGQSPPPPPTTTTNTHQQQSTSKNNNNNNNNNALDTPLNATRRPDTNQCYSFVSCLLCPPLGIIALIHSFLTDRAWKQGRYSDAVGHAREAPKYAGFAVCVGIAFWIWWLFLSRRPEANNNNGVDWFKDWDFLNFGD